MAAVDQVKVSYLVPWKRCSVCQKPPTSFKTPREFCRHLRDFHCTKEGGSFVCRYGPNGVCPSLPLEGVSDRDYEDHVAKDHVAAKDNNVKMVSRGGSQPNSHENSPVPTPSTEPSVVQDQHKWTMFMSKVNLPAALNDPRLMRRETDFFSKTWGESFERVTVYPSPHIPDVSREHFRKYVKKTSKRYQEHMKGTASVPPLNPADILPDEAFPVLQARKYDKYRSELEAIPKLFMHPGFSLANPDTFNAVFPLTHIDTANDQGSKFRQSSKLLQEKLSHYLDLVEVQIAKQISLRSDAFFQAMTSHDKLQENLLKTCTDIKQLREKIHCLDDVMVKGPLKIMELTRTRNNYVKLFNKLKLMSTIHQTQPTIQLLLATNDYVGALDLISTTQEILTQELAGVHSFRHLGSQLNELEKLIDKMMQEDFVAYATRDLNRPLPEGNKALEEETDEDQWFGEDEDQLVSIVLGMLRQHKYHFIDVYREETCATLKTILKQTVIAAVSEADNIDADGGSLADHMRLLNYSQWMDMLNEVFTNLLVILKRVKIVTNIINEVLLLASGQDQRYLSTVSGESDILFDKNGISNGGNSFQRESSRDSTASSVRLSVGNEVDVMMTAAESAKITASLREMFCQVCDHAHDRCVKLLIARARDGFLERLSSSEFVLLSRSVESFVGEGEALCGRRSTSLRASLQSQATKFVNRFHEERKTKLSLILDNERWKQADVPAEFQLLVDHIAVSGELCLPHKNSGPAKDTSEYLLIGSEKYAVVGTVLMLVKMVVEYCQFVDDIPTATPDILTRLIELLKMFNSRTCQLILGAGAVQLVGLRTISTRNLALSSRCLQLVVHYLPLIREHFESRLQGKQINMLKHFEHLLKDYTDHISEIGNKLVAIMDSMLDMILAKWEVKAPMPSACFRNICKQMAKFHEAISELLPQEQVLELFTRVHSSFKIYLRSQLIRLGVTNDGGPQSGLVVADVAFYTGSVSSLTGLESLANDNMDEIWDQR